jgi:hypothetical protein
MGGMEHQLGSDTVAVLTAAGLIFLWALGLGVLKYRQIMASPDAHAHPYTDIAHRAALLYSFAALLIAVFVELSAFSACVNLIAAFVPIFFFVSAIATYQLHGMRGDTDNQLREPVAGTRAYMAALIIGEIGGFAVLLAGFADAQIF